MAAFVATIVIVVSWVAAVFATIVVIVATIAAVFASIVIVHLGGVVFPLFPGGASQLCRAFFDDPRRRNVQFLVLPRSVPPLAGAPRERCRRRCDRPG
jgi:hypothetical protein